MDRFWSRVEKTDSCWLWTGRVKSAKKPYGGFDIEGRKVRAHRFSYELHFGPIPDGLCVCHTCDNPRCVNPDHLWLGTHQDNLADMVAKGRQARGSGNGKAKLTEADVLAIRASSLGQRKLGRIYGVTPQAISHIVHRKRWKHV